MTAQPTSAQLVEQGLFHHRQGDLSVAMDRTSTIRASLRDVYARRQASWALGLVWDSCHGSVVNWKLGRTSRGTQLGVTSRPVE